MDDALHRVVVVDPRLMDVVPHHVADALLCFGAWSALVGIDAVGLYVDTWHFRGAADDPPYGGHGSPKAAFEAGHPDAVEAMMCALLARADDRHHITFLPYVDAGTLTWLPRASSVTEADGRVGQAMSTVLGATLDNSGPPGAMLSHLLAMAADVEHGLELWLLRRWRRLGVRSSMSMGRMPSCRSCSRGQAPRLRSGSRSCLLRCSGRRIQRDASS